MQDCKEPKGFIKSSELLQVFPSKTSSGDSSDVVIV